MEFKGTPGPWHLSDDGRLDIEEKALISGRGLALRRQSPNARLIAAAPDLLEALKNLLWHAEQLEHLQESERGKGQSIDELYKAGEMHPYMVNAKSLIARATGEQS